MERALMIVGSCSTTAQLGRTTLSFFLIIIILFRHLFIKSHPASVLWCKFQLIRFAANTILTTYPASGMILA
jgi:hypothetical protein